MQGRYLHPCPGSQSPEQVCLCSLIPASLCLSVSIPLSYPCLAFRLSFEGSRGRKKLGPPFICFLAFDSESAQALCWLTSFKVVKEVNSTVRSCVWLHGSARSSWL